MSWDWDKLKEKYEKEKETHPKEKRDLTELKGWLYVGTLLLISLILIAVFWYGGRWLNYKWNYEHKIEQKVIEMVNPDALKEKYKR